MLSLYELGLPEADPIYTLKKVMKELSYSALLSLYSDKGRKEYSQQSEKEVLKRQIRSIQTERHFGNIKKNEAFRRFNYHFC